MYKNTIEFQRLQKQGWKKWGPYLAERQWGTVREDYSPYGSAWDYFTHDQARSRVYRWGEDGLAGISDDRQLLCFSLALWNHKDPILKERLFGLTGSEGNHGEDVKEYYFYLDSTPTHSYMKYLYKYPQEQFPYDCLVSENRHRDKHLPEYELLDTGVFDNDRYFDVFVEYIKLSQEDIGIKIEIFNRGNQDAKIKVLPHLWFRNTWSWTKNAPKPCVKAVTNDRILADHPELGQKTLYCNGANTLLFTENETNYTALYGTNNASPYVKDAFHRYIIHQETHCVNPDRVGTKACAVYDLTIQAQSSQTVYLRLSEQNDLHSPFDQGFRDMFSVRLKEADEFYHSLSPFNMKDDMRHVQRQAFAGMLWSKQYFYYDVTTWLRGDPTQPKPPAERKKVRNSQWVHLDNADILSMPDKWEYPWFAAWDLAFHCIPLAMIDPEFAKHQLDLMTREWYMHPNGQIPAYEWNFSDVNPPVHAWATWRVYKIEQRLTGKSDRAFLERVFQKLLMNFTWWVNRKDAEGNNVFEGGFLGLDNIGVFDRSAPLPTGGYIEQSDGTSWMGMYSLNMLTIALELARQNPVYEDMATKFFEHFVYIADAMNHMGSNGTELWDKDDKFYYDVLNLPNGEKLRLKVRSMVGLIPLFAVTTLEPEVLADLPGFTERLEWFLAHRPELAKNITFTCTKDKQARRLLSIVKQDQLQQILHKMLDPEEFLGDYGICALSRYHKYHPYIFEVNNNQYRVDYEPAESSTGLFGGNSNWRGPVWFPVNYLIIESLQKFHRYYGDSFKVECPANSGNYYSLWEVAAEIERRLIHIFLKNERDQRPVFGNSAKFQNDPYWQNHVLFFEYFHGDHGSGVGASHQTGWTGLVAKLIQQYAQYYQE